MAPPTPRIARENGTQPPSAPPPPLASSRFPSSSLTSSNPFPETPGSRRRGHILQQGHPRRRLRRRIRDAQDHGGGGGVLDERHRERARGIRLQTRPGDLPWGFEQRAKVREAEAKAYGAVDAAGPGRSAHGGPTPGTVAGTATGTGTGTGPSPSLAAAFGGDRHAPPPGMGTNRPRGYPRGRLPSRGR